jgi:phospholipid/cholesterol/gamma-HCH transport system substrate-binding protein
MVSAARVGALVVLFVAMGIGALAILNQSLFSRRATEYRIVFADAGGLTPGSRVMMSGVLVGRVERVALTRPDEAVAVVSLNDPHVILRGSTAVLPSSLISIGDREVQIIPGRGPALPANSTIPGEMKSAIESFIPDADKTMGELTQTLSSLNRLLNDKDLKGSFVGLADSGKKTLDAGADTAVKVGQLVDRFDGIAAQTAPSVQRIIASSEKAMASITAMTAELQQTLAKGEFQSESLALLKKLNLAAEEGRTLVAELNKVVTDPQIQGSLKTTTANVSEITTSGVKVAKDFEVISAEGIEASKKVNELLVKANAMADDVKKLLEQFRGTVERLGGGSKDVLSRIEAEAELITSPEDGRIRTDLTMTVPVGKEKFLLGVYDAFEANKITLQYKRSMDESLDLRYGVYASKPGLGVDYRVAPNLFARGDLYGLNDPRFDLRMRYDFNRSLYGWVGFDRLFDKTTPTIGFGVRRRQ